jgi:hypothetical protein
MFSTLLENFFPNSFVFVTARVCSMRARDEELITRDDKRWRHPTNACSDVARHRCDHDDRSRRARSDTILDRHVNRVTELFRQVTAQSADHDDVQCPADSIATVEIVPW